MPFNRVTECEARCGRQEFANAEVADYGLSVTVGRGDTFSRGPCGESRNKRLAKKSRGSIFHH